MLSSRASKQIRPRTEVRDQYTFERANLFAIARCEIIDRAGGFQLPLELGSSEHIRCQIAK